MSRRTWILVAFATLVIAVGSFWLGTRAPFSDSVAELPARLEASRAVGVSPGVTPAQGGAGNTTSSGSEAAPIQEPISAEERRKRSVQLQAEMSALLAQGSSVSPQKAAELIDRLERLSQGSAEAAHFRSLKSMLESTSKIQALNAELQRVSGSTAPEDVARRQAILAELRQLAEQIAATAADIRTRMPGASAAGGAR